MAIHELDPQAATQLAQQLTDLRGQAVLAHRGYQLRPATRTDLEPILVLERYCFSPWLAFGRRHWREQLQRQSRRVWLILDGEQVLAYLALLPHRGWHQVSLTALAVHWQHRQQGLGSLLLVVAELEAQARGLGRVRLEVDCDNEEAVHLYQRKGYVAVETIADYYGVGRPGIRLEKRLTPGL
jgi:[ribosomal protein S18]-alanine N-acetyltransferase